MVCMLSTRQFKPSFGEFLRGEQTVDHRLAGADECHIVSVAKCDRLADFKLRAGRMQIVHRRLAETHIHRDARRRAAARIASRVSKLSAGTRIVML